MTVALAEAALLRDLRARGDETRAAQVKQYMKSPLQHWGVPMPQMDAALRRLPATLTGAERRALATRLWTSEVWDLRVAACRILRSKQVAPDDDLWRFVRDRMADLDGWGVADNLADVARRCLIADERRLDEVKAFVESPHLWTRRAALVFTLPWMRAGRDPEPMLGWSARLVPDREWFIQKAIGWQLRELSKRDPERVRRFLADHGARLKAFARREAEKYL